MIVQSRFREFTPIIVIFIILNALFISGRGWMETSGISQDALLGGNLVVFALTFFSFLISEKGLQHENPHIFLRAMYSGILVKFFIGIIAAFAYIFINRKDVNKPAIFIIMGMYLLYTFVEVAVLTRMLKKKNG